MAISRERLEELIEQRATIYEVKYNKINPVSLKRQIRHIYKNCITFEPSSTDKYQNVNDYEHNKLFVGDYAKDGYLSACRLAKNCFWGKSDG